MKMDRTLTCLSTLVFVIALSAGPVACKKEKATTAPRRIDFNEIVLKKQKDFLAGSLSGSTEEIALKKSQLQDQILQEFDQCPQCFLKKVIGAQRTYLFDAIVDCGTTMRVGSLYDGGKWLCNPQQLPRTPIAYSFGVGDDISFDMDVAGMFGCDVYMFDPTPSVVGNFNGFKSGQSCGRGHISFQPIGLGPVSSDEHDPWNLVLEGQRCAAKSLGDIARSLNHTHVDILKIDIEGGEFAALKEELASQTLLSLNVRQLLVEFHLWNDECFADFVRIVGSLKKQGFLLFRKEFNPYAAEKCAEYAFVRL
jgi:hypothetical protein